MDRVGASEGVVGVKDKYEDVIRSLQPVLPAGVRTFPLSDTYPAGDEFILVHDVTGRVIPPGGLPRDVGALVVNVETLVNVGLGRPVTHKVLTVAGAVKEPVTLRVPVGTSIGEVIAAAGGTTEPNVAVLLGGVMMARPARSLDEPVTKTTAGSWSSRPRTRSPAGTPRRRRGIVVLPPRTRSPAGTRRPRPGREDRARRLRPVPLLHGAVPAVPDRAPDRAAPRHAGPGLRRREEPDDRRHPLLLRVQPLHALLVPGGPRPEERVRGGETGRAGEGAFLRGARRRT